MHLLPLVRCWMLIYLDPGAVFSGVCECPLVGIWLEMLNWVCFLLWDAGQTDNGVGGSQFLRRAGARGGGIQLSPLFSTPAISPQWSRKPRVSKSALCSRTFCSDGMHGLALLLTRQGLATEPPDAAGETGGDCALKWNSYHIKLMTLHCSTPEPLFSSETFSSPPKTIQHLLSSNSPFPPPPSVLGKHQSAFSVDYLTCVSRIKRII